MDCLIEIALILQATFPPPAILENGSDEGSVPLILLLINESPTARCLGQVVPFIDTGLHLINWLVRPSLPTFWHMVFRKFGIARSI
jgi:hypothetical protein